jgi:hypothetical protein
MTAGWRSTTALLNALREAWLLAAKNWLFAASDAGGQRAAVIYRLNGIHPEAYLRHVLTVIADHPINRVAALISGNLRDKFANDKAAAPSA